MYLHSDYQYLSPTIGRVLLNGTLNNLRFYECSSDDILRTGIPLNATPSDQTKQARENCSDPTVRLIYNLFSPPATLNVSGDSENFFFLLQSVKPALIADLLNYTAELRGSIKSNGQYWHKFNNVVASEYSTIAWGNVFKVDLNEDRKDINRFSPRNENFRTVLELIRLSIENECLKRKYPKYFTEQIILGYFCMKFNYKSDILELLENLDEGVRDGEYSPSGVNDIWSNDDISSLSMKPVLSLDEFYFLLGYSSGRSPYEIGEKSKNSSVQSCKRYERENVIFIEVEERFFQDCVENAILHFLNIVLFDKETGEIDINKLVKISEASNLVSFFKYQKEVGWKAETPKYRTEWNKVVGDLNFYNKNDDIISINYERGHYSLATGFVNFVNVLFRITGNYLDPLKSNDKMSWVLTKLISLISEISVFKPKNIDVSTENVTYCTGTNEIHGEISITIDELTFMVSSNPRHMYTVVKEDKNKMEIIPMPIDHPKWLPTKFLTVQSLWVLNQGRFKSTPEIVLHNVYEIYAGIDPFLARYNTALFTSNEEQIKELSKCIFCRTGFTNYELPSTLTSFELYLGSGMYKVSSGKALTISSSNAVETNFHLEVPNLSSVKISGINVISASFKYCNLSQLSISGISSIGSISGVDMQKITKLELVSNSTEKVPIELWGAKSSCIIKDKNDSGIRKNQLSLSFVKLTSLCLDGFDVSLVEHSEIDKKNVKIKKEKGGSPNRTEESIEVSDTQKKNVLDLSNFSILTDLKIINCEGIGEILLPKGLNFLDLNNSSVQVVEINACANLRTIGLVGTRKLESSKFINLPQLEYLNLLNSSIKLVELTRLPRLIYLNLNNSKVETIEIDGCDSLETIQLIATEELKLLKLTGLPQLIDLILKDSDIKTVAVELTRLSSLSCLDLKNSSVETIKIIECENLNTISLVGAGKLKSVELTNLLQLEHFSLQSSSVKVVKLTGLPSLPYLDLKNSSVQTVEIDGCDNFCAIGLFRIKELKSFKLTNLPQLKYLDLQNSSIEVIELTRLPLLASLYLKNPDAKTVAIKNCGVLEDLNFYNSQSLGEILIENCEELISISLPFQSKNQTQITLVNLPKLETIKSESPNDIIVEFNDGCPNRKITCTLFEIVEQ